VVNGRFSRRAGAEQLWLLAGAGAAFALLLWAGRLLGVGIDFSDDGYYLNLNADPGLITASAVLSPLAARSKP